LARIYKERSRKEKNKSLSGVPYIDRCDIIITEREDVMKAYEVDAVNLKEAKMIWFDHDVVVEYKGRFYAFSTWAIYKKFRKNEGWK